MFFVWSLSLHCWNHAWSNGFVSLFESNYCIVYNASTVYIIYSECREACFRANMVSQRRMSRHDLRISQESWEMAPTQATHVCLRGLLPFWDYFITGFIRNQDWQHVFKTWIIDAYALPCHLVRAHSGSPSQYVPSSSPYTYQSSSSSWKCQRLTEISRAARGGRPLATSAGSQAPLQVPPWTPSIKWWTGVDVSVTVCQ